MRKSDFRRALLGRNRPIRRFRDGCFHLKHLVDAARRGSRLGKGDHQIRYNNQRQQCLRHVVDKGDDFALCHPTGGHAHSAEPNDRDHGEIHNQVCERV